MLHRCGRRFTVTLGAAFGCPFEGPVRASHVLEIAERAVAAPRASGNIATEDLLYMLHGMGIETGVDLDALLEHASWLAAQLGRELPGQVYRAGSFKLAGEINARARADLPAR